MTIGVVTTSYPRFDGDPAGSFVGAHVAALRALGHDVEVIAAGSSPGDDRVTRITSSLFYRGGAPDAIEASPLRSLVGGLAFSGRLTAAITQRARSWDSIIAHWLVPSAIAALPTRIPLLAIAHGGDVYTLRRLRLLRPVLHALRLRGARQAFVSDELRAIAMRDVPELARWLAGSIVQPMGIDVARFAAIPRAPTTPPTILVASRLVPIKGVDIAIAAMRFVRTPARLVIAGEGPQRGELERAARDAGKTELLGEVSTEERDRLLSRASVVVVPSRVLPNGRTEGTPLIAIEALAAGVPVIASAVGGLASLAGAHRVRPDDPRALAAAIDRVVGDPPSSESLRASVNELDWARVGRVLGG